MFTGRLFTKWYEFDVGSSKLTLLVPKSSYFLNRVNILLDWANLGDSSFQL